MKNGEGYRDPTAGKAMFEALKPEKPKREKPVRAKEPRRDPVFYKTPVWTSEKGAK